MAEPPAGLFEIPDAPPEATPDMSADQRRGVRQARAMAAGSHPLSLALGWPLSLHAEAGPADDRTAPGLRCGNCRFREVLGHQSSSHPKCTFGADEDPWKAPRATHGAGTDVRAWWPACTDHQHKDQSGDGHG